MHNGEARDQMLNLATSYDNAAQTVIGLRPDRRTKAETSSLQHLLTMRVNKRDGVAAAAKFDLMIVRNFEFPSELHAAMEGDCKIRIELKLNAVRTIL
jgi:hypothetical protein